MPSLSGSNERRRAMASRLIGKAEISKMCEYRFDGLTGITITRKKRRRVDQRTVLWYFSLRGQYASTESLTWMTTMYDQA